jgi:signal peptide peptidase SppA
MIDSMPLWALAPSYAANTRMDDTFAPPRAKRGDDRSYAVVPIEGTIYKDQSVWIRQQVLALAADPDCGEIILKIDSPGGQIGGVADCATAVARAATEKPVTAFIEDLGASAAYWIASQARTVICNRTAVVGSIGAFIAVADDSKFWQKLGIEWFVIKSGGLKGGGAEGVKISQEILDALQARVDALARVFVADVARGRQMSVKSVNDIADGRVFVGSAAQAAGLVDSIGTFDDVLAAAARRTKSFYWNSLTGEEAEEKFQELVSAEPRIFESETRDSVEKRMEKKYPKLAAAAQAYDLSKSRWRPGF